MELLENTILESSFTDNKKQVHPEENIDSWSDINSVSGGNLKWKKESAPNYSGYQTLPKQHKSYDSRPQQTPTNVWEVKDNSFRFYDTAGSDYGSRISSYNSDASRKSQQSQQYYGKGWQTYF